MHATAVTASQSMPAGQPISFRTMASCYNCCAHSLPGPCIPFVLIVSAYRYIATATLASTAVFLEYLRQFLIDLHQIYRHSSVPKTRLRAFFELLSSSGFRARRRRDFFLSRCVCHGLANPSTDSHFYNLA